MQKLHIKLGHHSQVVMVSAEIVTKCTSLLVGMCICSVRNTCAHPDYWWVFFRGKTGVQCLPCHWVESVRVSFSVFYFKVIRPLIKIIIKIENVKVIAGSSSVSVRILAHANLFKNHNNYFFLFFSIVKTLFKNVCNY